jgi:hypothetical protein
MARILAETVRESDLSATTAKGGKLAATAITTASDDSRAFVKLVLSNIHEIFERTEAGAITDLSAVPISTPTGASRTLFKRTPSLENKITDAATKDLASQFQAKINEAKLAKTKASKAIVLHYQRLLQKTREGGVYAGTGRVSAYATPPRPKCSGAAGGGGVQAARARGVPVNAGRGRGVPLRTVGSALNAGTGARQPLPVKHAASHAHAQPSHGQRTANGSLVLMSTPMKGVGKASVRGRENQPMGLAVASSAVPQPSPAAIKDMLTGAAFAGQRETFV